MPLRKWYSLNEAEQILKYIHQHGAEEIAVANKIVDNQKRYLEMAAKTPCRNGPTCKFGKRCNFLHNWDEVERIQRTNDKQ